MKLNHLFILFFFIFLSCKTTTSDQSGSNISDQIYNKGTFGYDLQFLSNHYDDLIILSSGSAQLVIAPGLQGRIMTSTADGMEGLSFGWLNYELIGSGEKLEHFNPVGGEERFWLGPEGGQYSIYFEPGVEFTFDNWYVPKEIDTEPFLLTLNAQKKAHFEKEFKLLNYKGSEFNIKIQRKINLLEKSLIEDGLEIEISDDLQWVGYESENILTNIGQREWNMETGMLSIWILNMFNPSPATTIIVPFREGDTSELGRIVTDDYFGKVPADRLKILDGVVLFKADGALRSKIGLSPQRAFPLAGAFDSERNILTFIQYSLDIDALYVNSLWEHQEEPFKGDAFNAYNDGPFENGEQLGPFFELESSSPAAHLMPGASQIHLHRTIHLQGPVERLDSIALEVLGVSIENVMEAL